MSQHGLTPPSNNPNALPPHAMMSQKFGQQCLSSPGMFSLNLNQHGMPQHAMSQPLPNMSHQSMGMSQSGITPLPPHVLPGMGMPSHAIPPSRIISASGTPLNNMPPQNWRQSIPVQNRPPMWQGNSTGPMQLPMPGMTPMRVPGGPMNPPVGRPPPPIRGSLDTFGSNFMMGVPQGGPMAPPGMFQRPGFVPQVPAPRVPAIRQGSVADMQAFADHLKSPIIAPLKDYSYMDGKTRDDINTSWLNEQNVIIPRAAMARFLVALLRRMKTELHPADGLTHSAVRDGARRMYLALGNQAETVLPPYEPLFKKPFGTVENDTAKEDWSFAVLAPFFPDAFFGPISGDGSGNLRSMFEMDGDGESPEAVPREDGWAFAQRVLDKASTDFGGPLGVKAVRKLGLREEASDIVSIMCSVFKNRVERLLYIAERHSPTIDWRVLEGCIANDVIAREQILSSKKLLSEASSAELEQILNDQYNDKPLSSYDDIGD